MKIYKFKDLRDDSKHHHLFQIINENKVWCASPECLNDEKEFHFEMDYRPTEKTEFLLTKMIEKFGEQYLTPNLTASYALQNDKLEEYAKPIVLEIIQNCRTTIGITSFSAVGNGSRLWEEYGGVGNGAAVEFELSEKSIGQTFYPVDYVSKKMFHVDIFLESQLGDPTQIFKNILCTKTKSWAHEQEIRFLGKTPNVNITFEAPVTGLTIGNNVSEDLKTKLISYAKERNIDVIIKK